MLRSTFLVASIMALGGCGTEMARPERGDLRIALVGQSLSRYDPCDFPGRSEAS